MHVLILTHTYPNHFDAVQGLFVKDQVKALSESKEIERVGVIALVPVSIKSFSINKSFSKDNKVTLEENALFEYVSTYYNLPKRPKYCVNKMLSKGLRFFEKYMAEYGKPDLIHVHRYESAALAIKLKNNYSIPYVLTEHSSFFSRGVHPNSMEEVAQNAFKNASYNIAVSESFVKTLAAKYKVDFQYIPNIVDTDFFLQKPKKNTIKKGVNFFNVAALNANKNHELMIRAFHRFNKENTSKLIIAGDGELKKKLQDLIFDLGLQDAVFLIGRVTRKQIIDYLHAADLFLLSSNFETFGIVLIEALSTGTPVLSTYCGGAESIIKDKALGELVEADANLYYQKMKYMTTNLATYNSDDIRSYVVDHFSKEKVINKLVLIYKKVIAL